MTWQATAYVLKLAQEREDLTPLQILLCYAIAGRYSREHHCAFGQSRVMVEDTHLSVSKLFELIGQVEDMEIVSVWTGPLPRRRDGAPRDGRKDRGLMYCFTTLDPDGPDVEGAVRRPRQGGRPPKVGSAMGNSLLADRFSGNGEIGSPVEADRFSGNGEIGSPDRTRLNNRLLTAGCRQPDRQEDSPSAHGNSETKDDARDVVAAQPEADGVGHQVWLRALSRIRDVIPPGQFNTYLAGTRGVALDRDRQVLRVTVTSALYLPWLEGKLSPVIHSAVADLVGTPVRIDWEAAANV